MDVKKFLEPKGLEINGVEYIISKMPAVQAQQVYGAIMKECKEEGDIGMTYLSTPTVVSLLSYAARKFGDEEYKVMDSEENVNFCCDNVTTLIQLEAAMIRYNFGFLFDGTLPKVLGVLRDSEAI